MADLSISPLQLYRPKSFSGLDAEMNLANAYLKEPHKVDGILSYAFGGNFDYTDGGRNSVVSLLTGGMGKTMIVENEEYQWALHGLSDRAIEVLGNYGDGGSTPGLSMTQFRVKLAERFFAVGDNLVGDDTVTQVRVQSEPFQDGNGFQYTFVLASGDLSKFIDPALISAGAKWSKDYSTVESTLSRKAGGTDFSTPFQMKNRLTTLRKHYTLSRKGATDVLVMELASPTGQKTKLWTTLAEWTAMAQWYREKDRALMYSKYNADPIEKTFNLKGQTGFPVQTGAGLRDQIAPSNVRNYTKLSYELLDGILMDLNDASSRNGGTTKFVALTGKMGMREFSTAISDKFKSLGVTIVNEGRFISGSGNELVFTGDQWMTARFPGGIELTVKEFSHYDDITRNRKLHPKTLKPIESYRFSIFNFGSTKDGQSNIRKVVKKDSENRMWYNGGSIDPRGITAGSISTLRSSDLDGCEVHFLTEEGIMMADPTSSAELIFNLA